MVEVEIFFLSLRFQIITLLKDLELIPCPVVEREKKSNEQRDSVMEMGKVWEVLRESYLVCFTKKSLFHPENMLSSYCDNGGKKIMKLN